MVRVGWIEFAVCVCTGCRVHARRLLIDAHVACCIRSPFAKAEFPLDFVRRCTNGFNDSHLEGQGGFGSVYRGVDPVYGFRFAVKRLSDQVQAIPQQRQAAEQSLMRELAVLRTTRHPHMIRLLGYCIPGANSTELCLIYELG